MGDDSPTVLLVDDEEDVVEVYALALSRAFDLRRAHDGEEALEKIDEGVDAVVLDRRMPGLSGNEVLDAIRERDLDVRVAMVTAVDPDFDVVEMEFDAYLTKPVDDEELRTVVEELLVLSEYDDRTRELVSLAERKAALEAEKTERELEESDEYGALQERSSELDARVADVMERTDRETFEKMLARFSDGEPGED